MADRVLTVRQRQWHVKPLGGEVMYVSSDRRWAIIEGNDHYTLLENGATVVRLPSQKACAEEAYRRMEAEA